MCSRNSVFWKWDVTCISNASTGAVLGGLWIPGCFCTSSWSSSWFCSQLSFGLNTSCCQVSSCLVVDGVQGTSRKDTKVSLHSHIERNPQSSLLSDTTIAAGRRGGRRLCVVLEPQETARQPVHQACDGTLATTARFAGSSFGPSSYAGDVWYLVNSRSLRRCGGTQVCVIREIICSRNGELSPEGPGGHLCVKGWQTLKDS